jgi:hypothetical protein
MLGFLEGYSHLLVLFFLALLHGPFNDGCGQ